MKRCLALLLTLLGLLLTSCGGTAEAPTQSDAPETSSLQTEQEEIPVNDPTNRITLTIGKTTLHATLADNASAKALTKLLQDGPITMPASNYGGFEKVCELGHDLPTADVQTTTAAGDIMLYCGDQMVLFHGSNRWAYTRLGWVDEAERSGLAAVLGGREREVILALEN